ncbi:uncharacterized protein LOC132175127 isoform X2 [Corylus avellana]|uniref:uncharacterized protein LOC132175127 isoform X2 n=1 Tax=Corylus avellana TaxID=13451 RepID=UPI00286D571D|nr:uncharacterized protein LOC132175127 isoform X2 [Corylus avellana]
MQGGKKKDTKKEKSCGSKALVEYRAGKKCKHEQYKNYCSKSNGKQLQHQGRSFTLHNTTVTYGNADGSYVSSSTTRMTGSDGLTILESNEAETSTRQGKRKSSETSTRQAKRKSSKTPTRQAKRKSSDTAARQAKRKSSNTTATRQVKRKVSGGLHNKGHCNLNEGEANELLRFEHSWNGNDTRSWSENFSGYNVMIDVSEDDSYEYHEDYYRCG